MESKPNIFQKLWQSELRWPVLIALLLAFLAGMLVRGGGGADMTHAGNTAGGKAQVWTCSMHPQIRQPAPGTCPICGMELIPLADSADEPLAETQLKLSPYAAKLAGIRTVPVERRYVEAEINMSGKIDYDETRLKYITARVPGRIDNMFVDYTGTPVRENDHLVDLYSPELIAAQQELLQTLRSARSGSSPLVRNTLEAAREKLRLWGLTDGQIREIEQRGTPSDHLTIYSPVRGVVIRRNATKGMYVDTGTPIYTIADLSQVWVMLDAYESDLEWIRFGQPVEFYTEAYPGETFKGRIFFIDPVLNPATRTVKVRLNVANPDGKLKPEMFVRAVVRSRISRSGRVMDAELAGKWISPMHPEIIKDRPGTCDVCGMKLVRAEDLGYVAADAAQAEAPLVIPVSAPLITGKRAVVYLALPGREGVFEGREVLLGPRAGDYYLVREGLNEGDEVVVNGNFKLDSDLQIKARPSMMSPVEGTPGKDHAGHAHAEAADPIPVEAPAKLREAIAAVFGSYIAIQQHLSQDQGAEAAGSAAEMVTALQAAKTTVPPELREAWQTAAEPLGAAAKSLAGAAEITAARTAFEPLSESLYRLIQQFGISGRSVYRYHCPMAFDNKGADWLQDKQGVENPYFGSAMFRCGEEVEKVAGNR